MILAGTIEIVMRKIEKSGSISETVLVTLITIYEAVCKAAPEFSVENTLNSRFAVS